MFKSLVLTIIICFFTSILSAQIDITLFNQPSLTESITIVDCTLSNGSSTQCYQIKVFANDVNDDGPYCPSTINDIGGMGIYEPGSAGTNVGLSVISANLLNLIESDGFDIVKANGDVNVLDPGPSGSGPSSGTSYCLQASADNDLELVYLIPITPELLNMPNQIGTVEQVGISLNGIPIKGSPPAVIGGGPGGGSGNSVLMPALDACGGHHDPAGYYHWHFVANSTNDVLSDLNITEVSCTGFEQDNTAIMGYAMDGYPIYGQYETTNTLPTGLDSCNGHFGITNEFPSGIYHYHAVSGTAPNIPPCLKGASANDNFTYDFHTNTMSVDDESDNISVSVFPNPSIGDVVEIQTIADSVLLYDNLGRDVTVEGTIQKTDSGFIINTSKLTKGIYHIIIMKDKFKLSKKIIITEN